MAYNLLKGKKGIIFGALDPNSIAWKTAERVHEEGGEFVLTNAPIAMRMGQINELAEKTNSEIIPALPFLGLIAIKKRSWCSEVVSEQDESIN